MAKSRAPRTAEETAIEKSMREWGNVLSLWRLCDSTACRRAHVCRGNGRACFTKNYPLLGEGVRAWFEGIGQAQEDKLSFDEAIEWLDGTRAGEAFRDWNKAVEASAR